MIEKRDVYMSRMKTIFLYVLGLVAFFIFSELMININLESSYQKLGRKDNLSQVSIYQAEATIVNGRIKGTIINPEINQLNGKYLRFDFYSSRDVLKGTKYIDISNLGVNQKQELEMHFKLEDVDYYNISVVNEKEEKEVELLPNDLTRREILVGTIFTLLIIW